MAGSDVVWRLRKRRTDSSEERRAKLSSTPATLVRDMYNAAIHMSAFQVNMRCSQSILWHPSAPEQLCVPVVEARSRVRWMIACSVLVIPAAKSEQSTLELRSLPLRFHDMPGMRIKALRGAVKNFIIIDAL